MRKSVVLGVVACAALVGACRSSASTAATVEVPDSVPTTTVDAGDPSFPVTVDTDLGPVVVTARPERIVSLSATHTEMLFAVGAGEQVVATDLTSNYPPEAERTEKIDSFSFSIEEVAALEPDLVVLAFGFQGEAEALAAVGIPFLLLGPPENLEGAFDQLETVGSATGNREEAGRLATDLRRQVAELTEAAAVLERTSFYHEVDETLYSATSESFIGDMYRRLGLVNIADRVTGGGAFPQLTAEFIVAEDPELIFLADTGFGVTIDSVEARPGWNTIRAIIAGNVIELDGDAAGRWGPRTVELMAFVYRAVEEAGQ